MLRTFNSFWDATDPETKAEAEKVYSFQFLLGCYAIIKYLDIKYPQFLSIPFGMLQHLLRLYSHHQHIPFNSFWDATGLSRSAMSRRPSLSIPFGMLLFLPRRQRGWRLALSIPFGMLHSPANTKQHPQPHLSIPFGMLQPRPALHS